MGFKTCALGLWSLVLCFAQLTNTAAAATYYVDDTNGNDSYVGDSTHPWKTLARAYASDTNDPNVHQGDTVYFKNGNYGTFRESTEDGSYWYTYYMTRSDWITYKAATGHTPELNNIYVTNSGRGVAPTYGNSYLIFDGFKIDDGAKFSYTNYVQVKNCTVATGPENVSGFFAPYFSRDYDNAVFFYDTNYVTVQNNTITNAYRPICVQYPANHTIIKGNTCHHTGYGMTISGCNDVNIEDNYLYDMDNRRVHVIFTGWGPRTGTWNTGDSVRQDVEPNFTGIVARTFDTNQVYIYVTSECMPRLADVGAGTITDTTTGGTLILKNVDPDHSDGIEVAAAKSDYYPKNIFVRRNRVIFAYPAVWAQCGGGIKTGCQRPAYQQNVTIENNLVVGVQPTKFWSMRDVNVNNNVFYGGSSKFYITSNGSDLIIENMYNNIFSLPSIDPDLDGYSIWIKNHGKNIFGSTSSSYSGGPTHPFVVNSPPNERTYDVDRLFVSVTNYDFRPVKSQLTVDYADSGHAPATDILGNPRVGAPDIGCYEYNNTTPVLGAIGNKTVDENSVLSFHVSAFDADGDTIVYSDQDLPAGAIFADQNFSWRPGYTQAGSYPVTFIASDGQAQDSNTITITVNNVNGPPVLTTIGNPSINENSPLSFLVTAFDPDGDTITFSAQNLPAGATFDVPTHTFSWTPNYTQAGSYDVTFIASAGLLQDSETITITVNNVNRPPVLATIGNKLVNENSTVSFSISATDADIGDTITYSAQNLPTGATFVSPTFSWTPNYNQAGSYPVTFIASDGLLQDSKTITITVTNVNRPPVLASIGNKSVNENSTLSFSISATDADIGDTITYSATGLPSGATLTPGGSFSWTPDYTQAGSYPVIFIASDGLFPDSETITITVNNVNRPPVLASIGNKSVHTNILLAFDVNATDPDGNTIIYSATGLPTGATFTGRSFSWTPGTSQTGSYPVTFTASDGLLEDSETITITVNTGNQPPVLDPIGNKLVHTKTLLAFNVNATDPEGNPVTYSATGLPTGATFTGRSFRWTPGTSQEGTYYVTFRASDGLLQNSETITITVFLGDISAPTVNGLSPAANSTQAPLDGLVTLNIADAGDGVDACSVTININGNIVYTGDTVDYNSSYGDCHRTGTKANYTFIYQPHAASDYDQTVSIVVNARNLAGNTMTPYSYSFVTETRSFGENKKVNSNSIELTKGHPATVRDSAGNIWVAWHAGLVSSSGMKRGIYVGKLPAGADNFSASVREADNLTDRCNAAIAIDAYDKLYLAWQDNRRGKWDIYMSTSVDGINWSTEKRVTDSDSNAVNPVIAVDHSLPPKAYIAWQDDRADNQEIYIASSSDDFATETISRITSDSSDQTKPAIAVDSANTAYVVWADSRNGSSDIYGAASNNGPWANVPIVTKPGNQTNPAIATEATGTTLHLLWVDDTAGNKDIYYTASNGLPGTPLAGRNIVDDSSGADQLTPVIITTGSTGAGLRVFACWQDTRNIDKSGRTDLYFAEVSHGQETNIFVGDIDISSNKSAPVIGIDRYGYPYLVWADDRNINTAIYYAGSTFVHSDVLVFQTVSPASDAIIGTDPASITGLYDVSIEVPAGAYPCELNITISKIENPPKLPVSLFTFPYWFGPSGVNFNQPVTITIPYSFSVSNATASAFAYWYNRLADALSQQDINDIEPIAISPPTLYALRFKTTRLAPLPLIVGGNVRSSIQVAKCTITAGSKDNSDKTSISGKIDATTDNFTDAAVIEVTVDSNAMDNPCVLTFPINSPLKKGKYSYSGTEGRIKKSFKYDVKTHSFAFTAANVNLSGLGCPLTFDINVGDYFGTAEINETIVNGGKSTPMTLLMGVQSSLRVDTCRVKPGKKPNTDQLLVKGGFAVEDTTVDMANRVSEGLVVILGTQTFTISKNDLKAGKGKFTCSKAIVPEGGVATASFDFNKGSFMMTISNTNITTISNMNVMVSSGTIEFGVAFAGYSQIRQVTLM